MKLERAATRAATRGGSGPDPDGAVSPLPRHTRATVFIDGIETGYERAGEGSPIILLVTDPSTRTRLMRVLAGQNRVIVPLAIQNAPPAESCSWLRGLLVGLGIEVAGLVVGEAWSLTGLCTALSEPDRIDRLALVIDRPVAASPSAGIEDRSAETGQRLLMVNGPDSRDGATGARLAAFFSSS